MIFVKELLEGMDQKGKCDKLLAVPEILRRDLSTIAAIVCHTLEEPLPIVERLSIPAADAMRVWTDASGHIIASPSLGILVPSRGKEPPLVASLAFPRSFLQAKDSKGHAAYCKTTTLECMGILAAICLDPLRFIQRGSFLYRQYFMQVCL